MKPLKILIIGKSLLYMAAAVSFILFLALTVLINILSKPTASFYYPGSGVIVIDPGHGGVDGGTSNGGLLEKDINLDIAMKLKALLEQRGYKVVMTRDKDISLDKLNQSSSSRHKRDLNARVDIINKSGASLFISIHVNSNFNKSDADGSIVFYSGKREENGILACYIQLALNSMKLDGEYRTANSPLRGRYYILGYSKIPGVLVETAFISNSREKKLLETNEFRLQLAEAIAEGTLSYLADHESNKY